MKKICICIFLLIFALTSCKSDINEEKSLSPVLFYDPISYEVKKADSNDFFSILDLLEWDTGAFHLSYTDKHYVFISEKLRCKYYPDSSLMHDTLNNLYAFLPEELSEKLNKLVISPSNSGNSEKTLFAYDTLNKEVHFLDGEKSKKVLDILQNESWEEDITKTVYSHLLLTENGLYRYCPDSNIINDPENNRHLTLTSQEVECINNCIEK